MSKENKIKADSLFELNSENLKNSLNTKEHINN